MRKTFSTDFRADGEEPADAQCITGNKPAVRKTRDVYVCFDNDHDAHALPNAMELMQRLHVQSPALKPERQLKQMQAWS